MKEIGENIYCKLFVQRFKENKTREKKLEIFFRLINEEKFDQWLKDSMNCEAMIEAIPIPVIKLNKSTRYNWKKMLDAAAILALVAGKNKAVPVLADRDKIILCNVTNGQFTEQGNSYVFNKNGKLDYNANEQSEFSEILYHTLITSRGETSSLTLTDGS